MRKFRILLAAIFATFVLSIGLSACLTVPQGITTDCSTDAGPALSAWLDGLPPNQLVELPTNGCFNIATTLDIHGTQGLTIVGNGARLVRHVAGAAGKTNPLVKLESNTGLKISGVTIQGAYDGSNGGAGHEGQYGFLMEDDHNVTLTAITMQDVQGDFINLQAPFDVPNSNLNTGINISDSTFSDAGYHGLTVEAANGLTVDHNSFTNMGVDAMDFEYDVYSSAFDAQGNVQQAAQDNVRITNNVWTGWSNDWFASLQGQLPGVQEDNVVLSGNTLNAGSPLVEITGSNPGLTPAQYQNRGLNISGNVGTVPAISTRGSSITDPPNNAATMSIIGVVGAIVTGNTFPLFDGLPDYFANTPYIAVMQAFEDPGLTITHNAFNGASGIQENDSAGNVPYVQCGNSYGVNGMVKDTAC